MEHAQESRAAEEAEGLQITGKWGPGVPIFKGFPNSITAEYITYLYKFNYNNI